MAEPSMKARDDLGNNYSTQKNADENNTSEGIITTDKENIRVVTVDELTVEKIILERTGLHEVIFTKSERTKKLSESTKRYLIRPGIGKAWKSGAERDNSSKFRRDQREYNATAEKNEHNSTNKSVSKLPVWKAGKNKYISKLSDKRDTLITVTDRPPFENYINSNNCNSNIPKICKVPPIIPPKPYKSIRDDSTKNNIPEQQNITAINTERISSGEKEEFNEECQDRASIIAHERLEKSQTEIERLQQNLVKINSVTAESYKLKLPILHPHTLKVSSISDVDLNKNITKAAFDKEFLARHSFNPKLEVDERQLLEADIDYTSDAEKVITAKCKKPKYSKEVSEIEKRWSGEFLESQLEPNSSGSSKSSYIEEIGSTSSHESVIELSQIKHYNHPFQLNQEKNSQDYQKRTFDEILEDTVSTIDSTRYIHDHIEEADEYSDDNESKDSTLKQSSTNIDSNVSELTCSETIGCEKVVISSEEFDDTDEWKSKCCSDEPNFLNEERQYIELQKVIVTEAGHEDDSRSDGYAELIKEITMEPGPSKGKEEKKKKGGLRRLLPGIFSPRDSRKEYKKEHKEKKKRDERHFNQHQQNGIYMRSPDTMHLNEDIKRNVNLDTSLNGTIIEERLNEIKQELFPDQGMTTSTPDHFLQSDRDHVLGRRTPRLYTANSSLSSIAVEDKWIDQNIISGSPDMRKFKQHVRDENDRKCSLERKHSLQESQPRFLRNHGPSGRISAPPSERFLIRPRAVHPMDRPLPAIPQRVEFTNYENHAEIRKHPRTFIRGDIVNYQAETYFPGNQNYTNEVELYENGNNIEKTETNRNHSIDSGFNMTPVSTQLKMNRQLISNLNGQKIPCGIRRSPKYSPSSSQKSGDYADSSYTPNSSQKSEFSPGSSKSGEYYLNSPRNSNRMSPDYSINDRRDQPDLESAKCTTSYQIPSNIKVHVKNDRIYNDTPKSPSELDKSQSSSRIMLHSTNQDAACVQRGSPNIPLSSNLAKLRANVGNSSRSESPKNLNERIQSPQTPSPITSVQTSISPSQSANHRDSTKSPLISSPTASIPEQRFTSPLTIVTPASPVLCINTVSPDGSNRSRSATPLSPGLMSPSRISVHGRESQYRTPVSSPTMNQMRNSAYPHMSTFQPRKAQPTDQILIASPKREPIYDSQPHRPSSRMESACPDSPVPMVDSPCYSVSPRQNLRTTVAVRFNKAKSPDRLEISGQLPPEAFRDETPASCLSRSLSPQSPDKGVQRPEPIYIKRHNLQRKLSPDKVNLDQRQNAPSVDGRTNMLLIQAKSENINKVSIPSNTQVPPNSPPQEQTSNNLHPVRVTSPRPMSPEIRKEMVNKDRPERLQLRKKDGSPSHERPQGIYGNQRLVIQDRNTSAEDIYGKRLQQSPVPSQMRSPVHQNNHKPEVIVQQHSTPIQEQQRSQRIYTSKAEALSQKQEKIYGQHMTPKEPIYSQRNQKQEPVYGQRIVDPIYGQNSNKPLSPSKRQTMQHLEAFYWQQKALEMQKATPNSSNTSIKGEEPDSPEVREAIYWHQLKKLNEEQQRKIYEQNHFDERNDPIYWKKKIHSQASSSTVHLIKQGPSPSLVNQKGPTIQVQVEQRSENPEQMYWRSQMQPTGNPSAKPPLSGQKGQNQPVLVVRPQQTVRESNQMQSNLKQDPKELRSKSVSPHFVRNDERRSLQLPRKSGMTLDDGFSDRNNVFINARKSMTPPIYDDSDIDKKQPPPIFKRGSLISNSSSSVEYGTMGTKRVSFSNQSHSPEIGSGNWPTKHGMAPEPPTRKHRTEEENSSDTIDHNATRFHEQDPHSVNNIYGNTVTCAPRRIIYEMEYDANKPLPPPPNDLWMMKPSNSARDNKPQRFEVQRANVPASPRKLMIGMSESESGSEAGEVQRILHRRNEEEWNPGGKGRQSNETGGLGRAEGEGGSNDLPSGRRSGGAGVLGSVVGGRSTGTSGGGGGRSRDEPRRHTLSGDHAPSLHHQQFNAQQFPLHPHHLPLPHGQYGTPPTRHTTMDLEMGTKSRQRKSPLPRGYPPPSTAMLFDDDPGIMSEVETSSTGFRRGGKQRSSLPVVRTPSKTLERPLGLVFLQYRKETKRALLPNEITSIDTVKALFVRSFSKQLTMEYLDSPDVKVYIHDSNKDMFYELEDHRSHLRDIRDRSVLRLIEKTDGIGGISGPLGAPVGGPPGLPPHWEDQSYFSEPEFDSEFQHQHIHKSKTSKNSSSGNYYMGGSSTLPRGGPIMRAYSPAASAVLAGPNTTPTPQKALGTPGGGGVAPAKPLRGYQCGKTPLGSLGGSARFSRDSSVSLYSIPDRLHGESGYMSSPERGGGVGAGTGRYSGPYSTGSSYEEPYYSQYSGTVTPVIDEEASDTELLEESYSLYGVKPPGRPPSGPPRSPFPPGAPALPPGQPYDVTRIRVEHMERQLANLTGLVQKALTHAPHTSPSPRDYLQIPAGRDPYARSAGAGDEFDKHSSSSSASLPDDSYLRSDVKPPKLGKDKSVSFEKSVSFSDEPPDMNSPKQHSPQHTADTKPTKPAIKSSTLPRMSSQERDRHKPTPPPKPVALATGQYVYRDLSLTPEMYNQLRGLQKKAKDLRQEVRNLRRMSQAQAHTVRETIWDTFITIRAMLLSGGDAAWAAGDAEKIKLSREEDLYKQEMIRLEKDLTELESTVEELRGNVITRKTRVNMSDVENMALILSKSSKTVADLKVRFPSLQEGMKGLLSSEMEKVVREEKFLKEEPDRLESALRRCKKLTGTLVTLKRLASVQEQRLPNAPSIDLEETPPITPTSAQHSKTTTPLPTERTGVGSTGVIGGGSYPLDSSTAYQQRPENALDALLDELQTFSRPSSQLSQVSCTSQSTNHTPHMLELGRSASQVIQSSGRAPNISDIGRKGSIDSSSSLAIVPPTSTNTLRRLHSYPSSSDTDTSPPIARIQVSDGTIPPQKPPVPERNAELLQLATARRVPPPPPPRTSSRSPLASPTSPQLPPRNPTGTLRRGRPNAKDCGKPPMALPPNAGIDELNQKLIPTNNILSASNSSSCESINSQEGLQNKKDRQEQLEQRHQELLRQQKALQEQYARLQQLQRNASGLTTVPPTPPDLLKKTGSESNLLAKMGLGMSAASSGSLTSLATVKNNNDQQQQQQQPPTESQLYNINSTQIIANQTTVSKIYETDIL